MKKFADLEIKIDTSNKEVPIYVQIKRQVLAYAKSHDYKQDDQMPDITTIAKAAGVSLRTANQAMESLATDGYCYRRAKNGSYYQEPSRARRKMCAVLLSKIGIHDDEVELGLYNGVYTYGMENKIDVASIHSSPEEAFQFYNSLDQVEFLGMVVLLGSSTPAIYELAQRYPKKTFVFLCPRYKNMMQNIPPNCYIVTTDSYDGAYRMAEYYAGKGIRSMAVLSMELEKNDETYILRENGFFDAAKKYGIKCNPKKDRIMVPRAGKFYNQRQAAYLTIREFFAKTASLPEVLFCINDNLAIGALEAIEDTGLKGKCVVTGYDGFFSYHAFNKEFSTVKTSLTERGQYAMSIIENPEGHPNITELKAELKIVP